MQATEVTVLQRVLLYLEPLAPALGVVALAALLSTQWVNPRSHRRFAAALDDLGIAALGYAGWFLVARVVPGLETLPASFIAALYLVLRDAMMVGSGGAGSIAKRLLGLRVTSSRGGVSRPERMIVRNLPLALIVAVSWWPSPAARFAYPGLALVEVLLVWLTPSGRRLGDLLAGTVVCELQAPEESGPRDLW